ncbi:proliferating cell nuclear antigen (pcna) [Candidatus Woesearchaeota archaeon]|nr:proliferating cell nuclear antigen (pcna) [Candidatus Woesearchaeota archaeon]|tara:strand:- start:10748 stop:11494 length:747 start_codon:yes stop_codon:yes gene_type:complete
MKLTLAEPKYLKESVTIISELVNEARFKVSKEAIELVAMDPANVAMVIFKLLSSSFTEYDVKKDVEIAINLSNLKQIMRRAKPNDMLTLELDPDNKLRILLKGDNVRTFNLPIIELDEKEQKIPDLKFPINVNIPSSILNEAIEDVDVVAESVTFLVEPKKFTIHAEGDLSQAKIEMKEGDNVKIKAEGNEKVKAKYSVEYLKKMISGSKIADDVFLYFSNDYPLKIEYKTIDKVMLSFILAPRVEND